MAGSAGKSRGWRAGAAFCVLVALACAGGCGRGDELACDSQKTQDALFAALRADYPNKASQEMFGHGSTGALERILKAQHLDRDKPDELRHAMAEGLVEAKTVYQTGHYLLENAAVSETGAGGASKIGCSARVVFLTAWGIVVKLVSYDVIRQGEGMQVSLQAMK